MMSLYFVLLWTFEKKQLKYIKAANTEPLGIFSHVSHDFFSC